MKFPTHAVLGTTTGKLLGDIGGIYKVISFLIGRPAYTHDLAYYGRQAGAALRTALPGLPTEQDAKGINSENYRDHLKRWEEYFGQEIDLPDTLRDVLANDKDCIETATEMVGKDNVIVIDTGHTR